MLMPLHNHATKYVLHAGKCVLTVFKSFYLISVIFGRKTISLHLSKRQQWGKAERYIAYDSVDSRYGQYVCLFVCLFCCFTSQVNSYGHGGTVNSPNHTFFLGKLEQAVNQ